MLFTKQDPPRFAKQSAANIWNLEFIISIYPTKVFVVSEAACSAEMEGKVKDSPDLELNVANGFCVINLSFYSLIKVIRLYQVDCSWSLEMRCGGNGGKGEE